MKEELSEELVQSVREMGAITRGEVEPTRTAQLTKPDVKEVCEGRELPTIEIDEIDYLTRCASSFCV